MVQKKVLGIIVATLLYPAVVLAQSTPRGSIWVPNLDSISSHDLPWQSPCKECTWLTEQNTDSTRTFSMQNGGFAIQAGHFFFRDEENTLLPLDPRIEEAGEGTFVSLKRPVPVTVDVNSREVRFAIDSTHNFVCGRWHLVLRSTDGTILSDFGMANWSDYSAGDDGIRIADAWEGIDIEIVATSWKTIETNIVVKHNLGFPENTFLVFSDDIVFPNNFTLMTADSVTFQKGNTYDNRLMVKGAGATFDLSRPFLFDGKARGAKRTTLPYYYGEDGIEIQIPTSWFSDAIYPVTLDPIVTAENIFDIGDIKFSAGGTACGGIYDCSSSLSVHTVANAGIDSIVQHTGWTTESGTCGDCTISNAYVHVYLAYGLGIGCQYTPTDTTWYNPTGPGADLPGSYEEYDDITDRLSGCTDVNLCDGIFISTTTFNTMCGVCPADGGCTTLSNPCSKMYSGTWWITAYQHTLGTTGDSVFLDCWVDTTLSPLATGGIEPYAYDWSDGEADSTEIFYFAVDTSFITYCTVTDACDVSSTAAFYVDVTGCNDVLPLGVSNFNGAQMGNHVLLTWETTGGEYDVSYYLIERSNSNGNFQFLATVDGLGQTPETLYYNFEDDSPFGGNNYYRLSLIQHNGKVKVVGVVYVYFSGEKEFAVYPNPAYDHIFTNQIITIYSGSGKKILENVGPGEVEISAFPSGIYFAKGSRVISFVKN